MGAMDHAQPAASTTTDSGAFLAIVGASGVGKDALISYARERLAAAAVYFPRRVITRREGAGEDHEPIDEAGFAAGCACGDFAVSWRAHGLGYGIPAAVDDEIRSGRTVVANVSRGVLGVLAARYPRLVVVRVTVSDDVRASRLRGRGREAVHDIAQRLARTDPAPDHPVDVEIRNDGTVAEGGDRLLRAIMKAQQLV
ncbi:phosphonate metabolism protein/1,5-bisphosphokinase (PRPP-forming) PhnN [Arthrobacter sp. MA-N2]|uniref:phosphonate metabolism protein/1,5-bisphosphokinase (PRPP-forming) PhnN n=1 Tax=Arthrobacter sp. MA-N2 TaxID=1101188 RepID=UPI000550CD56|nr:phosphonate metabolism protein/1,5-bisphosphokinase (PRPP-forming) PhnN [Arthrobacter sp. MA-N2]